MEPLIVVFQAALTTLWLLLHQSLIAASSGQEETPNPMANITHLVFLKLDSTNYLLWKSQFLHYNLKIFYGLCRRNVSQSSSVYLLCQWQRHKKPRIFGLGSDRPKPPIMDQCNSYKRDSSRGS